MYDKMYYRILKVWNVDFELLNDQSYISTLLHNTALMIKSHIVEEKHHQFKPQGLSGFLIIQESHISYHTSPQDGVGFFEIATCNSQMPIDFGIDYIRMGLKVMPKCYSIKAFEM